MSDKGEELTPEEVKLSKELPRRPEPTVLIGERIVLEPLNVEADYKELFNISSGPDTEEKIWKYLFSGPFETPEDMKGMLEAWSKSENALYMVVRDIKTRKAIGMSNIINHEPASLSTELGSIWYCIDAQGGGVVHEVTHLQLDYLFTLGFNRVVWKCNALNMRSRRTAEKMGFEFEAVSKKHLIIKGRWRDTAWFVMFKDRWYSGANQELNKLVERACNKGDIIKS